MEKKRLLFLNVIIFLNLILILTLILITQTIALEIDFSKSSYQPREILQAEITGGLIDVNAGDFFIYEKGIQHPIPTIPYLLKKNNKYYFYTILPNKEGNFSFIIKNLKYFDEGRLVTQDFSRDLIIEKTNESALSIEPGFILTSEDFSIKIKNVNERTLVITKLISTDQIQNFSLENEEEKIIKFYISEISEDTILEINNYKIPIFLIKKDNQTETPHNDFPNNEINLMITPSKINASITSDENYLFIFLLKNFEEKNLTNLKFSTNLPKDLNFEISPREINSLKINESVFINLSINVPKKFKEEIYGEIILVFDNPFENPTDSFSNISIPIFFEIVEDITEVNLNETSVTGSWSCLEMGEICNYSQKCNGEPTSSLEGPCCIGECIEDKPKSSSGKLILFFLFLLVLFGVLGFYLYKKKKQKNKKSPEDFLKQKINKFEKKDSFKKFK